jgi:hypothetical protein
VLPSGFSLGVYAAPFITDDLAAGFQLLQPGVDTRSSHVRFMMEKVELKRVSFLVLQFLPSILLPPIAPHSLIILSATLYSLNGVSTFE